MVTRIALWTSPTPYAQTLLQAFGARNDAVVSEEPLAGAYEAHTERESGTRGECADGEARLWKRSISALQEPCPEDKSIWIQGHQARHLLPHVSRGWLVDFRHVFLVSPTVELIGRAVEESGFVHVEDTCLPHLLELHRWVSAHCSEAPVVLDELDLRRDQKASLEALCQGLKISFRSEMVDPRANRMGLESAGLDRASSSRGSLPEQYQSLAQRCEIKRAELLEDALQVPPTAS